MAYLDFLLSIVPPHRRELRYYKEKVRVYNLFSLVQFIGKDKQPFNIATMQKIFERVRQKACIKRNDGSRYQPRLHDLRHTFAVNRLVSWYKENKNVQQLLPVLSVYMGHKYLAHTSVYLTMTDDLLEEAKIRFEKYAITEQQ